MQPPRRLSSRGERRPRSQTLLSQMDTWSDNFIAEMLLKTLGARLAGRGSSAAGSGRRPGGAGS